MIHMQGEVVVNQPVEAVFDSVADARNEPRYNPNIRVAEKISSGPVGVESWFRNETVSMGRTTEWTIEITSYHRPRQLATSLHSSAMDIQGSMTFDSVDSGTRMRWTWELSPRGLFKLIAPLVSRMGHRLEEQNWEHLKQYLEAGETLQEEE